jgi:hypothetical protein
MATPNGTFSLAYDDAPVLITLKYLSTDAGGSDLFSFLTQPAITFEYKDNAPGVGSLRGTLTFVSAKQLPLQEDGGVVDVKGKLVSTGGNIGPIGKEYEVDLSFSIGGNKEWLRLLLPGETLSGGSLRKGTVTCSCTF